MRWPAAQYVRMSTENQRDTIRGYAAKRGATRTLPTALLWMRHKPAARMECMARLPYHKFGCLKPRENGDGHIYDQGFSKSSVGKGLRG